MFNPNFVAFIVSEVTAFIRTWLDRLDYQEYVYFIGSETLPPVTYFPTNLDENKTKTLTLKHAKIIIIFALVRKIK